MTIGKRIRHERLKLNLSQEELAKALSTTKQAIYKYENEIVTNIPMDKIAKLAELFNTTPAYLMGWEKQNENTPDENNLTEGEKEFLNLFRMLPEEEQRIYLEMLRARLNARTKGQAQS